MGLTGLSLCDPSINGIKDREDIYIMFHDRIIEKVQISTGVTSSSYSIFPLNRISPKERAKPHLEEMSYEMLNFVPDLNHRAFLSERSITLLNIAACKWMNYYFPTFPVSTYS